MRLQTNNTIIDIYRQTAIENRSAARRSSVPGAGSNVDHSYYNSVGLKLAESKMRTLNSDAGDVSRRAQEGISIAQTADAALTGAQDVYARMRELAVLSADSSLSDKDRIDLDFEYSELKFEMCKHSTVRFNGIELIKTEAPSTLSFQTGATGHETIDVEIAAINVDNLGDIKTASAANESIANIDIAINDASAAQKKLSDVQDRLISDLQTSTSWKENTQGSQNRVNSADKAKEISESIRSRMQSQSSSRTINAQADLIPQRVLQLLA